jgi:hypothetical protein
MTQLDRSIQKVLSRLMALLESIERRVDCNASDLEQVWEKVDVAMMSLSSVQEE